MQYNSCQKVQDLLLRTKKLRTQLESKEKEDLPDIHVENHHSKKEFERTYTKDQCKSISWSILRTDQMMKSHPSHTAYEHKCKQHDAVNLDIGDMDRPEKSLGRQSHHVIQTKENK